MSTLAEASVRADCLERLNRLTPSAKPVWGRMTAHQMVCHLIDSFEVGAGMKYASPATGVLQRTVVKWVALRVPIRWPRNVPTRPEVEQGKGGTPPGDWASDRARLGERIEMFPALEKYGAHPIFGTMSRTECLIWGYRHVDHHLRQFGV